PEMTMKEGESRGKRAGAEEVKSESKKGEVTMQDEGKAGDALVAAESMAPTQIDVRMDVTLLHCQGCFLPLKPPVFKCDAVGHVVCYYCRAGHRAVCSRANTHCGQLDKVVGAAKVPCPYKGFGCDRYVVFHEAADHQRVCQCAPCTCPESGCPFVGSRAMLVNHFAADHQRPAVTLRYGRSWSLSFSLSHAWHLLVGEEDCSVFLVSLRPLGPGTAVSLMCVRPDGEAETGPRFWCKLSIERRGGDKDYDLVLMTSPVISNALSTCAPALGQGMFLVVPQELLSGDTLTLSVRIDLIPPAAVAPKSTTPQARAPRRMQ
uniref:SIAH-type domain-containing protein n=2 Tax=Aegilops tauschii TaxID=37682 RepID=A0A453DQ97_AEGTS